MNEYLIPAIVILAGNLFSGSPGSNRWEYVTAIFGWVSIISFLLWVIAIVVSYVVTIPMWVNQILLPIFIFCLLQTVSRDYERILKPIVNLWMGPVDRE